MRRIGLTVVLAVSLILAPLAVGAQQTEKVRRIGFLSGTNPNYEVDDALFRQILRCIQRPCDIGPHGRSAWHDAMPENREH